MPEHDDDTAEMIVATITIQKVLTDDDVIVRTTVAPEDVPLVDQLGMLRLAEDTAIRDGMGEIDEDGDDA